jgi:23S rRNA (adenine2030-N6)-methyltransferase
MNYRHIYHAGNICDVVKHSVLALLLEHLAAKDKPFCVLDTHAGVGRYDLRDPRAGKTGEAQQGILKLLAASPLPELSAYYRVLRELNPDEFHIYPGSPLLACRLIRAGDRLIACELHDEDAVELRRSLACYPQAQVHHRDGYEALRAFLPPAEKRGLVVIDPPYEQPDEFQTLVAAIKEAHRRWAQGTFLLWYPVKERPAIWRFHEALVATGIPAQLCAEFIYQEETRHDRLNGSGLVLITPPWKMDEKLAQLFPALHRALELPDCGSSVKWLMEERG